MAQRCSAGEMSAGRPLPAPRQQDPQSPRKGPGLDQAPCSALAPPPRPLSESWDLSRRRPEEEAALDTPGGNTRCVAGAGRGSGAAGGGLVGCCSLSWMGWG